MHMNVSSDNNSFAQVSQRYNKNMFKKAGNKAKCYTSFNGVWRNRDFTFGIYFSLALVGGEHLYLAMFGAGNEVEVLEKQSHSWIPKNQAKTIPIIRLDFRKRCPVTSSTSV